MIDLFEIQKYDTKNSCFGLKGGKYLDLVRVICTDFQSIREMDLEYENGAILQSVSVRSETSVCQYAGTVYRAAWFHISQVGELPA